MYWSRVIRGGKWGKNSLIFECDFFSVEKINLKHFVHLFATLFCTKCLLNHWHGIQHSISNLIIQSVNSSVFLVGKAAIRLKYDYFQMYDDLIVKIENQDVRCGNYSRINRPWKIHHWLLIPFFIGSLDVISLPRIKPQKLDTFSNGIK